MQRGGIMYATERGIPNAMPKNAENIEVLMFSNSAACNFVT